MKAPGNGIKSPGNGVKSPGNADPGNSRAYFASILYIGGRGSKNTNIEGTSFTDGPSHTLSHFNWCRCMSGKQPPQHEWPPLRKLKPRKANVSAKWDIIK